MAKFKQSSEVIKRIKEARSTGGEYLNLSHLDLREIPDAVFDLKNLTELDLAGNRICSIPEAVRSKLPKLKTLCLYDNPD